MVSKLMAKDPAQRYQTAAEVSDLLAGYLAEMQQPARPTAEPRATAATPRWSATRPRIEVLALFFSVLALAVGLLAWWTFRSRDPVPVARMPVAGSPVEPPRPKPPPRPPETTASPRVVTKAESEAMRQAGAQIAAGDAALNSGHHAQAIELFSQAIRLDPANLTPLLRRAGAYTRNEVENYLCRWLALRIGRGEAYLLKGDLDRALAECDEAVRFAPWSAEARLLRAQVHARRGEDDRAATDRREAQRLTPDPLLARPEPRVAQPGRGP
jgi:tetratricopeptide (TPR) repeat protein